jgi:hypothetical protein
VRTAADIISRRMDAVAVLIRADLARRNLLIPQETIRNAVRGSLFGGEGIRLVVLGHGRRKPVIVDIVDYFDALDERRE